MTVVIRGVRQTVVIKKQSGPTRIATGGQGPAGVPGNNVLTTRGDVIVRGPSQAQRLALGTKGRVLGSDGTDVAYLPTREYLSANQSYYVRNDGSDTNNGLGNTAGGAFASLAAAWAAVCALDLNGFTATIKLGNTVTLTAGLTTTQSPVNGSVVIEGDTGSPSNTKVTVTGGNCFLFDAPCRVTLQYLELSAITSGSLVVASAAGATVMIGAGMRFGSALGGNHLLSEAPAAYIGGVNDYTIIGGAQRHAACLLDGVIEMYGQTITLTGTPAFSAAFVVALVGGLQSWGSITFSGAATGVRYDVSLNAVINTSGGGATKFPGNASGTAATGGQYA